jgi:hypothetical protein
MLTPSGSLDSLAQHEYGSQSVIGYMKARRVGGVKMFRLGRDAIIA